MSYFNTVKLDGTLLDAFGRQKGAEPMPLFDNMGEYGNNTTYWESLLVSTGSIAHVANNCAVRLSTGGTTDTASSIRATRQYMRYQPGRSLNIETTFAMSAAQSNGVAEIGYYDAANGIFFQRSGAGILNIVRRTNVTGSPVDTVVAQSAWSVDKLNGTGASGITLDVTKAQILFIQLQFLGVGRVQVGFVINGLPYIAHEFLNANNLSTVYMSTGCLPVRGRVYNSGTGGGTTTMDMFCTSVSSGGMGLDHRDWYRSTAVAGIATTTTLKPILSIRAATLLGGTGGGGSITNRGQIIPQEFALAGSGAAHEYQVVLNGTLTGASWAANDALSIADYDLSATAITGGSALSGGFIASAGGANRSEKVQAFNGNPVVYTSLLNVQDIITLCARTLSGTGTVNGSINWRDEF
jgi:hypothetical protein